MGTSCTVQFKGDGKAHTIFQGVGGHPEDVIPELQKFIKWNGENRDSEYTADNFVFYTNLTSMMTDAKYWKEEGVEEILKSLLEYFEFDNEGSGSNHTDCIAIDNGDQNQEYTYIANLDKKTIEWRNIKVEFGDAWIPEQ